MSERPAYRPEIDGMRAIAILLVCIFHFQLLPIGEAGFIGVDVFFVISGFLITQILARSLDQGNFSLGTFYYRRVRRLYPALLVMLCLYLVAGYFLFLPRLFDELAWETFFSLIYGINFFLWKSVNYFAFQAHEKPLLHMWSLAVEEQFYLIYPLFFMALHGWCRGKTRWILYWLSTLVLASFLLGWAASYWKPQAAFYLLPTRAWELGAGGVLALWLQTTRIKPVLSTWAGPLAILLLIGALAIHNRALAFPGWYAALPVLASVLFIIGGEAKNGFVTRGLSTAPMVFFGKISYPLYLVHWPIKILLGDVLEDDTLIWRLGGFAFSILLAWAIYHFVETPIRTQKRAQRARPFLWGVGLTQIAMLLICFVTILSQGLPNRYSAEVNQHLAQRKGISAENSRCQFPKIGSSLDCLIGAENVKPKILFFGDSHSLALSGAMDLWLTNTNQSAAFIYNNGCLPVARTGPETCQTFADAVHKKALAADHIETVIIASSWRRPYWAGGGYEYSGIFLEHSAGHDAFASYLETAVSDIAATGKKVVLVEPMYWAQHPVPETLARMEAFGVDWELDTPKADYDLRFAHLMTLFKSLESDSVTHISLIDELCASGTCPAMMDGEPMFTDTNHMAHKRRAYFAGILNEELSPVLRTSSEN